MLPDKAWHCTLTPHLLIFTYYALVSTSRLDCDAPHIVHILFPALQAEYATSDSSVNQVVLWDAIIQQKVRGAAMGQT